MNHIVSVGREIAAPAAAIFEFIADPAQQPSWDGNDNLAQAPTGQRVRAVGDVFTMMLTLGIVRENHVVEFEEGRRIAWLPSEEGAEPPGHLWRWELQPLDDGRLFERAHDLGVEPAHDRRRKAGRRDQSLPGHDDMSGQAGRGDGRDIGLATKKKPPAFASGEETLIEMAEFRIAPPP